MADPINTQAPAAAPAAAPAPSPAAAPAAQAQAPAPGQNAPAAAKPPSDAPKRSSIIHNPTREDDAVQEHKEPERYLSEATKAEMAAGAKALGRNAPSDAPAPKKD